MKIGKVQSASNDVGTRHAIHLGIDAVNIRQGGGLTHLSRLLQAADPTDAGISRVTLWANRNTAATLPDRPWLTKRSALWMDAALPWRIFGQQFWLPGEVRRTGCDVLFSPGSTLPLLRSVPAVTLSQNMLPFEPQEAVRFGKWNLMRLKMRMLRSGQGHSFERADGLIFLTQYAQTRILATLSRRPRHIALIPHGIEPRFFQAPRPQKPESECSTGSPFRILYVSILMPYKHQCEVARAAALLRADGFPVEVRFVGPPWGEYGRRFATLIDTLDRERNFLLWSGAEPFESVHGYYQNSDLFVFASSCENLPNILIEAMAAGLPIAAANRGPMPETLGEAGIYFDPEQPSAIAEALRQLMLDAQLRARLASSAYAKARDYSWDRCARDTFRFIAKVARESAGRRPH